MVEILDASRIRVSVAVWADLQEYSEWRLLLAGPDFDKAGPRRDYTVLNETLVHGGLDVSRRPPVLVLPQDDPTIKSLRRHFGKVKSAEGMRLGGQTFGDRIFEDAVVFRIR